MTDTKHYIRLKIVISIVILFSLSGCWFQNTKTTDTNNNNNIINTNNNIIKKSSGSIGAKSNTGEFSKGKQEIIKSQLKIGPNAVDKMDCNTFDDEGKEYCLSEKNKLDAIKNEITWESVFKKGDAYIKGFNCDTIKQEVGIKYCKEYKEKSKNTTNIKK